MYVLQTAARHHWRYLSDLLLTEQSTSLDKYGPAECTTSMTMAGLLRLRHQQSINSVSQDVLDRQLVALAFSAWRSSAKIGAMERALLQVCMDQVVCCLLLFASPSHVLALRLRLAYLEQAHSHMRAVHGADLLATCPLQRSFYLIC